jgi:hypothetical protein
MAPPHNRRMLGCALFTSPASFTRNRGFDSPLKDAITVHHTCAIFPLCSNKAHL